MYFMCEAYTGKYERHILCWLVFFQYIAFTSYLLHLLTRRRQVYCSSNVVGVDDRLYLIVEMIHFN